MISLLLLSLLTADCGGSPCETFPNAKAAFDKVLATKPEVIGVGEYHQQTGAPKVKSAVKRFTEELLPAVKGRGGALIVETWVTSGKCGEVEKKATKVVAQATKRPKETEDEIETLLTKSYEAGFKNHILVIDCKDWNAMLKPDGSLDAIASLLLVRRLVAEKTLEVREKGESADGGVVLLYGGAVHNDVEPLSDYEDFSFGKQLVAATDGGYAELDLLVPEYAALDDDVKAEKWWQPALALATKQKKPVLVTPHPRAFFLVYPPQKLKTASP